MVGCQKSRILKGSSKDHGKRDRVRGEERRRGGGETGDEAEDAEDQVALPKRPILKLVSAPGKRAKPD
jgi:hypothetical protein